MADKNWQAGGKILIPAQAVVCLIAIVLPFGVAWGASDNFAPASYVGSMLTRGTKNKNLVVNLVVSALKRIEPAAETGAKNSRKEKS